jgi:phospholipase C
MHGLQQFYTDVSNQALPEGGGVFYVRGGYYNNDGLTPVDPNVAVQQSTPGNDDHPNYSDAQISEALIADSVNAIANSPYWADCAIIITYDETDGLYDHQPEQFRTYGPDHKPETGGPRIPAIVISPYAAAHVVSHVYSEHSSVVKFIDELFNLTPLAQLPDEAAAIVAGAANPAFNAPSGAAQTNLGPADALATMGDLTEAFDNNRLTGATAPLPASYAIIPAAQVHTLPHYVSTTASGPQYGCQYLGISPTDYPGGYVLGGEMDPPPLDFNPRPTESPGNPYLNTNNNTGGTSTGPWPN